MDATSVGRPFKTLGGESQTIRFAIHGMHDTMNIDDEVVESPVLRAHGHLWKIKFSPKGYHDYLSGKVYASCFLSYAGNEAHAPAVKAAIRCNRCEKTSGLIDFKNHKYLGWKDFCTQNYLNLGCEETSLVIEVDIWILPETKKVWYPSKLRREESLVALYRNDTNETTDVAFDVGGTVFRAHACILFLKAGTLLELATGQKNGTPVSIPGIRGEIFRSILEFVYTVTTPQIVEEDTAMEILVAADRVGCTQLKLYVESVIVEKFLTATDAADWLIFADSFSCALLREAALNLFKSDTITVRESESWAKILESNRLLRELLDLFIFPSWDSSIVYTENVRNNVDQMDVASLRDRLQAVNLEMDGSREVLVKRLKQHISRKNINF